ncbi:S8 family serine peptidase [Streptomyces sp. NPDC049881]|uniref:S8 family serine peptidase n=1 Tax=Streptomyces sp. NPDC049881 TaxID=3155778 RepID=UPI0034235B16
MTLRLKSAPRRHSRRLLVALSTTALLWGTTLPQSHAESPDNPWYASTFRLEEVWEHTRGEGITVAVIDSWVDDSLPELEGQVLDGTDLVPGGEEPSADGVDHGTAMASLIAGTGAGGGVRGLAPGVKILPIRADDGQDGATVRLFDPIADGIRYAVEEGAQIINISLVLEEGLATQDQLGEALETAARAGVLIFAGTGNEGEADNDSLEPGNRQGVVGIGAVDRNGERSPYSTYGPQVALASPGDEVPRRGCTGVGEAVCINERGGTSSATAIASGAAALIWSAHPDWTKNQVLRVMVETAVRTDDQIRDDYTGHGMIRPDRVILDGEGDPGDPDVNPLFARYERSLDPPPSAEPTAPEDDAEGGEENAGGAAGEEPEDQAREDADAMPRIFQQGSDGGGGSGPVVLFGLAGAVLVGGVTTAVVLRRRAAADVRSK